MWILCLAEDSLETSSLMFSEKQRKKYLWMSSAAVVIGALRVNLLINNGNGSSTDDKDRDHNLLMMIFHLWKTKSNKIKVVISGKYKNLNKITKN